MDSLDARRGRGEWQGSLDETTRQGESCGRAVGLSSGRHHHLFVLTSPPPSRKLAPVLETLRDVAVASMILSQFAIGATSVMSGHFRDAAIGTLCAVVNILIF